MSSATSSGESKMVLLKSSDGQTFELNEGADQESQTIKHMIEDECAGTVILLSNVTGDILAKIMEYCKYHDVHIEEKIKAFDEEFIDVALDTLYDLIMASNYLNIKSLLDLSCQKVADMMKGKSEEEIRKTFNIKNDFTEDQKKAVDMEFALTSRE